MGVQASMSRVRRHTDVCETASLTVGVPHHGEIPEGRISGFLGGIWTTQQQIETVGITDLLADLADVVPIIF